MADRRQRALRGVAVGAVSVLAGAVGHDLAGGGRPGWLAIAVGLAFALPLGVLLASHRPSLPRTAAVVALSQGAFHYLFVWLGSPALASGGHHHAMAGAPVAGPTAMTAMDPAAMPTAHLTDPRMALAHAIAAVITVALLRRAELAVAGLVVRRLRVAVLLVSVPRMPSDARPPVHLVSAPSVLTSLLVIAAAPRRGPPALSVA